MLVRNGGLTSVITDEVNILAQAEDWFTELFVIYNASEERQTFSLPEGEWGLLTDGTRFAWDPDGKLIPLGQTAGAADAAPKSVTILGR